MNLTLKQIKAFVAVAEAGSFTRAANQLHLTQSATSVLISELELQLDLRLFDRTTRQVQLNDAGRDFYPVAVRVLADLHGAVLSSKDLAAKKHGRVAIATTPLMASILLPKAIAQYTALYPGVKVVVHDTLAETIQPKLLSRSVDFGIGTFEKFGSEVVADPLMSDALVLVCPAGHPLSRKTQVAWKDLAGHAFISLGLDSSVGQLIRNCLVQARVEVQSSYEVSYLSTVAGMVGAGLGVAVLPSYAVPITKLYQVRVKKLVRPVIRRGISFLSCQGKTLSPAAESFKVFLKAYVKEME